MAMKITTNRLPERSVGKRRTLMAAVLFLLMMAAFSMTVQAKTLTSAEKAKIKYARYLYQHEKEGKAGYIESFALIMLDNNNVPDLVEQKGSDNYNATSVVYVNGAAYKGAVRAWADRFTVYYYYPKKGVYSCAVYDSDGSTRSEFLYRRLFVHAESRKDAYVAGMVKDDNKKAIYYKNEKENTAAIITQKQYNARIKQYTGTVKAKKIVFIKNTEKNRRKYLGDPGTIPTITLDYKTLKMALNEEKILTPTIKNGDSKVVTWKSDNPKVVRVVGNEDGQGVLTARSGGMATITARSNGVTATCKVTVDSPSVELDQTKATVFVKRTVTLKAVVTGPTTTPVTWKSLNPKKASVSSSGVVTGLKAGKARITASANGKTATCVVTVKQLTDTAKGLTKMAVGKEYTTRMYTPDGFVILKRTGSALLADGKSVMKTHNGGKAYALYIANLNSSDKYKEFLELYTTADGKSVMTAYRLVKGKITKKASISGKKGSTLAKGFFFKNSQTPKVPGDGSVILEQNVILGGKEKITVRVPYILAGSKFTPQDDEELYCIRNSNKTKSKLKYYDDDLSESVGSVNKGVKYTPRYLVLDTDEGYVGVEIKSSKLKRKVWLRFRSSKAKLN